MSSFIVFLEFSKQNREERGQKKKLQTYQFTQAYNILHRLQVHHLTLTFIIHNEYKYEHLFIYIATYMNCSSVGNAFFTMIQLIL